MSTPETKEAAAHRLRALAAQVQPLLDVVVPASRRAWRCPAASGFEAEAGVEIGRLSAVAGRLREVAAALDRAAALQRAAAETSPASLAPVAAAGVPPGWSSPGR